MFHSHFFLWNLLTLAIIDIINIMLGKVQFFLHSNYGNIEKSMQFFYHVFYGKIELLFSALCGKAFGPSVKPLIFGEGKSALNLFFESPFYSRKNAIKSKFLKSQKIPCRFCHFRLGFYTYFSPEIPRGIHSSTFCGPRALIALPTARSISALQAKCGVSRRSPIDTRHLASS